MRWMGLLIVSLALCCVEYQNALVTGTKNANYYPHIEKEYIRPSTRVLQKANLGRGCSIQITIPPLQDINGADKLYYIWFFDNKLLSGPRVVAPEHRSNAMITLTLEQSLVETVFGGTLPSLFFDEIHFLEFVVADAPYDIPESRYRKEGGLEDSVVWFFSFSNTGC